MWPGHSLLDLRTYLNLGTLKPSSGANVFKVALRLQNDLSPDDGG